MAKASSAANQAVSSKNQPQAKKDGSTKKVNDFHFNFWRVAKVCLLLWVMVLVYLVASAWEQEAYGLAMTVKSTIVGRNMVVAFFSNEFARIWNSTMSRGIAGAAAILAMYILTLRYLIRRDLRLVLPTKWQPWSATKAWRIAEVAVIIVVAVIFANSAAFYLRRTWEIMVIFDPPAPIGDIQFNYVVRGRAFWIKLWGWCLAFAWFSLLFGGVVSAASIATRARWYKRNKKKS